MTIYKISHHPTASEYYTDYKPDIISAKYIVFISGGDVSKLADADIQITKIKVISKKKKLNKNKKANR